MNDEQILLTSQRRWGSLVQKWAFRSAIVAVMLLVGASAWANTLSDQIQKTLESNTFLQTQKLKMRVANEQDGNVTLELTTGPKKLRDLFRKGYEINGDGFAETNLKPDVVRALRSIRRALKTVRSIKGVQNISLTGAIDPVMDQAENYYDEACQQLRQIDSQTRADAIPLLTKSAEMGFASAQAELSKAYFKGADVRQDDEKAIFWLQKAAEKGDLASQLSLAQFYAQGRSLEKDYKQAIAWYRKAADQERDPDVRTQSQLALATVLATCPEDSLRDGNAALEYAIKARATATEGDMKDILAAAYARCGRFEEAIEQEKNWIQQMQKNTKLVAPEEREDLLNSAHERLELYQKRKAFTAAN